MTSCPEHDGTTSQFIKCIIQKVAKNENILLHYKKQRNMHQNQFCNFFTRTLNIIIITIKYI